jgi:hypothetical protein
VNEVLIMQRMGMTKGLTPSTLAKKKAYEELFDAGPSASNVEALTELLVASGLGSRSGDARARFRLHRCRYFGCLPND